MFFYMEVSLEEPDLLALIKVVTPLVSPTCGVRVKTMLPNSQADKADERTLTSPRLRQSVAKILEVLGIHVVTLYNGS